MRTPGLTFFGVLWGAAIIPALMLSGAAWLTGSLMLHALSVLVAGLAIVILVAVLVALNADRFIN